MSSVGHLCPAWDIFVQRGTRRGSTHAHVSSWLGLYLGKRSHGALQREHGAGHALGGFDLGGGEPELLGSAQVTAFSASGPVRVPRRHLRGPRVEPAVWAEQLGVSGAGLRAQGFGLHCWRFGFRFPRKTWRFQPGKELLKNLLIGIVLRERFELLVLQRQRRSDDGVVVVRSVLPVCCIHDEVRKALGLRRGSG